MALSMVGCQGSGAGGFFSAKCAWGLGAKGEGRQRDDSTQYSQAVSHPSTNQARPCLASEIRRDRACSEWYGCGQRQLLPGALRALLCISISSDLPADWEGQADFSPDLLKLTSIDLVLPSNHLILCLPLLLLPPGSFPMSQFFCIRWPQYWSFSFSISLSSEYSELISFKINWFDLLSVQETLNTTVQKHQFFSAQLSVLSNSHIHT